MWLTLLFCFEWIKTNDTIVVTIMSQCYSFQHCRQYFHKKVMHYLTICNHQKFTLSICSELCFEMPTITTYPRIYFIVVSKHFAVLWLWSKIQFFPFILVYPWLQPWHFLLIIFYFFHSEWNSYYILKRVVITLWSLLQLFVF